MFFTKTLKQIYSNKIAYHNKLQAAHERQQWKQATRQASKRTQIFKVKQQLAAVEKQLGVDKLRKQLYKATMSRATMSKAEEIDPNEIAALRQQIAALRQQIATATKNSPRWQELTAEIKKIKKSFHDLELIDWTQKEVRIAAQKVNEEELTLQAVKHLSRQFAVEVQAELFRMASKEIQYQYNRKVLLYCSAVLGFASDIKQLYQDFKKYDEPDFMTTQLLDEYYTKIENVAIKKKMTEILSLTNYNKIYDACTTLIRTARKFHAELVNLNRSFDQQIEALEELTVDNDDSGYIGLDLTAFNQAFEAAVDKYFDKLGKIGLKSIQEVNKYIDSTDVLQTIEHYQNLIKDITGDENN